MTPPKPSPWDPVDLSDAGPDCRARSRCVLPFGHVGEHVMEPVPPRTVPRCPCMAPDEPRQCELLVGHPGDHVNNDGVSQDGRVLGQTWPKVFGFQEDAR